jgi:hypothetical protein
VAAVERYSDIEVEQFVSMLHHNPDLMPPVETLAGATDQDLIDLRRLGEVVCLKCGEPADVPLIADHPDRGRRWLDVCHRCLRWLKAGMDPGPDKGLES